jgi:hypothetical protein
MIDGGNEEAVEAGMKVSLPTGSDDKGQAYQTAESRQLQLHNRRNRTP